MGAEIKMAKVRFIILGTPVAKQRPRLGKGGKVYTPSKTKVFEEICSLSYGDNYFFEDEYIKVKIIFNFEVPKSYTKKKTVEALNGNLRPTRADIDNYIKSVLDGLNGKAWKDDRYITGIYAEKKYSDKSEIIVEIENMS